MIDGVIRPGATFRAGEIGQILVAPGSDAGSGRLGAGDRRAVRSGDRPARRHRRRPRRRRPGATTATRPRPAVWADGSRRPGQRAGRRGGHPRRRGARHRRWARALRRHADDAAAPRRWRRQLPWRDVAADRHRSVRRRRRLRRRRPRGLAGRRRRDVAELAAAIDSTQWDRCRRGRAGDRDRRTGRHPDVASSRGWVETAGERIAQVGGGVAPAGAAGNGELDDRGRVRRPPRPRRWRAQLHGRRSRRRRRWRRVPPASRDDDDAAQPGDRPRRRSRSRGPSDQRVARRSRPRACAATSPGSTPKGRSCRRPAVARRTRSSWRIPTPRSSTSSSPRPAGACG